MNARSTDNAPQWTEKDIAYWKAQASRFADNVDFWRKLSWGQTMLLLAYAIERTFFQ